MLRPAHSAFVAAALAVFCSTFTPPARAATPSYTLTVTATKSDGTPIDASNLLTNERVNLTINYELRNLDQSVHLEIVGCNTNWWFNPPVGGSTSAHPSECPAESRLTPWSYVGRGPTIQPPADSTQSVSGVAQASFSSRPITILDGTPWTIPVRLVTEEATPRVLAEQDVQVVLHTQTNAWLAEGVAAVELANSPADGTTPGYNVTFLLRMVNDFQPAGSVYMHGGTNLVSTVQVPVPAGAIYAGALLPTSSISAAGWVPEWVNEKSITTVQDGAGVVTRVDFTSSAMVFNPWNPDDSAAYLTFWIPRVAGQTATIVLPATAYWADGTTATSTAQTQLGNSRGGVSMSHTFAADWYWTQNAAHTPSVTDWLADYSGPGEAINFEGDASAYDDQNNASHFVNPQMTFTLPAHMELIGVSEVLVDGNKNVLGTTAVVETSTDCQAFVPAVDTGMASARCLRVGITGLWARVRVNYLARLAEPYRSSLAMRPGEYEFVDTPYSFTAENLTGGFNSQNYQRQTGPTVTGFDRATYWNLSQVKIGGDPFSSGPFQIGDLVDGPGKSVLELPWAGARISNMQGWDNIHFGAIFPLELDLEGKPALNPGSPAPIDDHGQPFTPTCEYKRQDRTTTPITPASFSCTFPGHFPALRADPYDPAVCHATGYGSYLWDLNPIAPWPLRLDTCLSSSRNDVVANNYHFTLPVRLVGGAQGSRVSYFIKAWSDSSPLAQSLGVPGSSEAAPTIGEFPVDISGRLEVTLQKVASAPTVYEGGSESYGIRFSNTGTAGTANTFIYDFLGYDPLTGARLAGCEVPRFVSAAFTSQSAAGQIEYTTDSPPSRTGTWLSQLPADPSAVTGLRISPKSSFSSAGATSSPLDPAVELSLVVADTAGAGSLLCNSVALTADGLQATTASAAPVHVLATPPTLNLPPSQTIPATSFAGAVANFIATATDKDGVPVAVACLPPSGMTFPISITTVVCTATANNGATASGAFTITVINVTPTVTATGGTFTYDGSPHGGSGSATSSTGIALSPVNLGWFDDAGAPLASAPVNAGRYTVVASFPGSNVYAATSSAPATIQISRALLTVTVSDSARVYGAPDHFVATYSGFVGGDTSVSGSPTFSSDAGPSSPVGNYFVGATQGTLSSANYDFAFSGGTLTISPDATETTLAVPAGPVAVGGAVQLSATVAASAPGSGTPTGSVTFFDDGVLLGTGTLSGGIAVFSATGLQVGVHHLVATYNSDPNFKSSESAPAALSVTPIATTTTLSSSANPSVFGQPVSFVAVVDPASAGAGLPDGIVSFYEGALRLGEAGLNNGQASFTTAGLEVGLHDITAVYSGSPSFLGSSGTYQQKVVRAGSSVRVASSQALSVVGQPITLTATLTSNVSGAGTPTGSVTFFDGTVALGTVAVDSTGHAALPVSSLGVGSHGIRVEYSGDRHFTGSTGQITQLVGKAGTTTAIAPMGPITVDQPLAINVDVSALAPGNGAPAGTVALYDGATFLGNATIGPNGRATLTTTFTTAGTHTLSASYAGDASFTGSSAVFSESVVRAATATTVTSSGSSSLFGQSFTLTAKVSNLAGIPLSPGGSVSFYDGGIRIGTATLTAGAAYSGQATLTVPLLPVGSHSITATYSGDLAFNPSTGATSQQITPAPTTTTVSSSQAVALTGQSVVFTAVVSSQVAGAGTPGGTVVFKDGGVVIGSSQLGPNGQATLPISTLAAGNHQITAAYQGSTSFLASTTVALAQTVQPHPTQLAYTGAKLILGGQSQSLTAVLTDTSNGKPVPNQAVTITLGGKSCNGVTDANGVATCAVVVGQNYGPTPINVSYTGAAGQFLASTATSSAIIYGLAGGNGSFVIGDSATKVGSAVTFWGNSWSGVNHPSGGPAPSSFKGFATSPAVPTVGTFYTRTGNSSNPPASVPSYMAVIVSSAITQSGSTITGNTTKVVIIQTDSGYMGNPGHPGTGTIVATLAE